MLMQSITTQLQLHQDHLSDQPVMFHIELQWLEDTSEWFNTQCTGARDKKQCLIFYSFSQELVLNQELIVNQIRHQESESNHEIIKVSHPY